MYSSVFFLRLHFHWRGIAARMNTSTMNTSTMICLTLWSWLTEPQSLRQMCTAIQLSPPMHPCIHVISNGLCFSTLGVSWTISNCVLIWSPRVYFLDYKIVPHPCCQQMRIETYNSPSFPDSTILTSQGRLLSKESLMRDQHSFWSPTKLQFSESFLWGQVNKLTSPINILSMHDTMCGLFNWPRKGRKDSHRPKQRRGRSRGTDIYIAEQTHSPLSDPRPLLAENSRMGV